MNAANYIAKRFHEIYEETAPSTGWQTQSRSRGTWGRLPAENRELMIQTVTKLMQEGVIQPGPRWYTG